MARPNCAYCSREQRAYPALVWLALLLVVPVTQTLWSAATFAELATAELPRDEWLAAFAATCAAARVDTTCTRARLLKTPEDTREVGEARVVQAQSILLVLSRAVDLAMANESAPGEGTTMLTALSALGVAALEPRPLALGNVEVSAAATMLWSGVAFRLLRGSSAEKVQVPAGLWSWTSVDAPVVAAIMRDEFGLVEGPGGRGIDQMLLEAVQAGNTALGHPAGAKSSPLHALGAMLPRGDCLHGFAAQIEQPDLATFAWDVLLAARLHALCRLELRSRVAPGSPAPGLAGAVAFCREDYSELEKRVVLGHPTDEVGLLMAVADAQMELRTHIQKRGLVILAMAKNRLGRTP